MEEEIAEQMEKEVAQQMVSELVDVITTGQTRSLPVADTSGAMLHPDSKKRQPTEKASKPAKGGSCLARPKLAGWSLLSRWKSSHKEKADLHSGHDDVCPRFTASSCQPFSSTADFGVLGFRPPGCQFETIRTDPALNGPCGQLREPDREGRRSRLQPAAFPDPAIRLGNSEVSKYFVSAEVLGTQCVLCTRSRPATTLRRLLLLRSAALLILMHRSLFALGKTSVRTISARTNSARFWLQSPTDRRRPPLRPRPIPGVDFDDGSETACGAEVDNDSGDQVEDFDIPC
ncbi:hypothetical protein K402DRAFT_419518 [Aulographum hederae CBS 113979]|uniref:Uncharacterized protein n=1 Tax=Aulographum hederae CBS 113979 TaxID=1176131 RepID=A0A6G1H562_9PEZI|nr:hypothetical protein K402DRAFT_419518 [Aulographum hederae CBS 113979]